VTVAFESAAYTVTEGGTVDASGPPLTTDDRPGASDSVQGGPLRAVRAWAARATAGPSASPPGSTRVGMS